MATRAKSKKGQALGERRDYAEITLDKVEGNTFFLKVVGGKPYIKEDSGNLMLAVCEMYGQDVWYENGKKPQPCKVQVTIRVPKKYADRWPEFLSQAQKKE